MRSRAISSALVVATGLAAVFMGGPVFALLFICLGLAGYREYLKLAARINAAHTSSFAPVGYGSIAALGLAALLDAPPPTLFALVAIAVVAPLTLPLLDPMRQGAFSAWSLASMGSLYLGLPVYAGIAIRSTPGSTGAAWLERLAAQLSVTSDAAPRGLSWALVVILATWVGDSAAYLVGSTWGRRKLAPAISPNKSVEGATGGLISSISVGALTFQGFGLGAWWLGMIVGGVIGVTGQLGDLAESVMKRQAGVKDSGAVIPGHGGILDRIDALLFAFPAAFVIAAGFERMAT